VQSALAAQILPMATPTNRWKPNVIVVVDIWQFCM